MIPHFLWEAAHLSCVRLKLTPAIAENEMSVMWTIMSPPRLCCFLACSKKPKKELEAAPTSCWPWACMLVSGNFLPSVPVSHVIPLLLVWHVFIDHALTALLSTEGPIKGQLLLLFGKKEGVRLTLVIL